jgi:hypothetical protein
MTFSRIFAIAVILFLATVRFASALENPMVIRPDDQFDYARSLYVAKDYIPAIVEFKRFIHFFPADQRVAEARYMMGLAWFDGGKPAEALTVFEGMMASGERSRWVIESHFMAARCHEATGNPVLGEVTLKNLMEYTDDTLIRDRARCAVGWLRISGGKWDKARESFAAVSPDNAMAFNVPSVISELGKTGEIPRKNPVLAGTLSIFPGAGYAYCGRYRDALVSFLINGGLIASAVQSFHEKHYALGGVITFVGFGFYAGNIYGAVTSANKYNLGQDKKFIESLKRLIPQNTAVGLFSDCDNRLGVAFVHGF